MDFDSLTTPEIRSWMDANRTGRSNSTIHELFIDAYGVIASRGEPLIIVAAAELPGPIKRADPLPACDGQDKPTGSGETCAMPDKTSGIEPIYAVAGKT